MPEPDARPGLELDPDTKARLAEVFAGKVCCECAEPAVRLSADQFYCAVHYRRQQPQAADPPKVYRCPPVGG